MFPFSKFTYLQTILKRLFSTFILFVPFWGHAVVHADTLNINSLFYSGTEYIKQFDETKGTPFSQTENTNGSALYFGSWYQNLDLLYDIKV
jgi:hypothetical protein